MKKLFIISLALVLLLSMAGIPCPVSADSPPAEVWVDDGWGLLSDNTSVKDEHGDEHKIGIDAFAAIQSGITAVADGGTVNVAAGKYVENIVLPAGKNVVVEGAGALDTIIDGDGSGSVVKADGVGPSTRIEGFTITNGKGSPGGGGIYINACSPTITNCIIASNNSTSAAGILINFASSQPTISNCLIENNTATNSGGGIYIASSTAPTILNCTIVKNKASQGGGIYNVSSASSITNTIIYDNSTGNLTSSGSPNPSVNYCCIGGGWSSGTGNTGDDPSFVSGDYRLQSDSPCIDKGTNTSWGPTDLDLDGNLRIHDGDSNGSSIVDMGVYEYGSSPPAPDDTQPPTASNPSPDDGSYTTDATPDISIDLTDDQSGVDEATIALTVEGNEVAHSWDGSTVSYTPAVAFTDGQVVNVSLAASDMAGNAMATYSWSFTVLPEYTLTIGVDPSGGGSVSANQTGPYHYNDIVELTATPEVGWSFDSWSGDLSGSTNPETIVMDSDKAITANFTQNQYILTTNIVGNGSVTRNPDGATYTHGTTVQLTAVPDTGWSFTGWSGDLSGSTNPETIVRDNDKAITATFTQNQYVLTTDIVGNGSVTRNPDEATYTHGTTVQLTAVPATGWSFTDWSVDLAGSTNPETITMDGDKSVIATFTESIQDEDTFQNFTISRMTINWAKDIKKPDKKWGWRSFFSWFMRFTHNNDDKFSISGRVKLPEGYTVAHMEESATVSVAISDSSGSDAVNFKERILRRLGIRWTDRRNSPGENMKITKMTIWWAPEERDWAGWAGFNIQGKIELPDESIGVNTTPTEATVTLTIPVSAESGGGSLLGEETIEFRVYSRSNQWSYYNSSLPFFRYEP